MRAIHVEGNPEDPLNRGALCLQGPRSAMFVEIGEELAREKGVTNGEKGKVTSKRGWITAVAVVTKRVRSPLDSTPRLPGLEPVPP